MATETEANGLDKLVHTLDLDDFGLDRVPRSERTRVKQDVADFIEEEMLRDISRGTSPVQGEGRFQRLTKDYAEGQKGGVRTSNLELEGDLLTDFFVKPRRGSEIEIGHTGEEVPKSDGHNQLSEKAKKWAKKTGFPKRRYIPDDDQEFKKRIRDGIKAIIDDSIVGEAADPDADTEEFSFTSEPSEVFQGSGEAFSEEVVISVDSLFSTDSVLAFLNDALRRSGRG